ncbi:helix-turn-helix domain-containing protein [bacterium]|jgi:excisionase family DNA binding protein|nr:helix-turn-helix domain-containing protein [bacterium]
MPSKGPANLLTKKDLCTLLTCKENTINHLVSSNQSPFIMIGREPRFNSKSIEEWLKKREVPASFSESKSDEIPFIEV